MKYSIFIFVFICIILSGCEKIIPNLPRDNPLDSISTATTVHGVSLTYANNTVIYDNNGDGIINKGETVYLQVYIKNNGTSDAKSVKATFSSSSIYLSQLYPTSEITYGNINHGSSAYAQTSYTPNYYGYYTICFKVSNTTPANTQIPINIEITDETGSTWTSDFNVTVQSTDANLAYSSNTVIYDNNGDGIINKGETAYLQVYLINNGTSDAKAVKATFSSTSSYLSQLSPSSQVTYGNINHGNTAYAQTSYTPDYYAYYTISFKISNTTPANTQIPINIEITDETGNTWTSSFNITVQNTNANLAYSSNAVVYDNNGDGIINKGETAYLQVYLINNGTSNAKAVKATFSSTSSYLSQLSPSSQVTYGNINHGNTAYAQTSYTPDYSTYYTISFAISSSTPTGTQIPISIAITDECSNSWSDSFNITVQ